MIGTQVGKYRIEDELGRGGMGVVYRGTQVSLDRTVAIKMLPAHLADGDNRARFRREALTLARLAHPNIVSIYDVEELDGHSFIVMEHVGGGSLADLLATGGPLPPTRAVEIMGPVLSALQAAHLAGIVHRDIKPDNILFTDTGRTKLTDFGVAHMRDGGTRTRTGVMLGTPYYMSPEQAQGRPVTAAADLYAVGVVLFEMLSGQVPFTGQDPVSVALKHVQAPAPALADLRPDLPPGLCALVERALSKAPEARFASAAVMQDALLSGPWSPVSTLDPASSGPRPVAIPAAPTAAPAGADSGSAAGDAGADHPPHALPPDAPTRAAAPTTAATGAGEGPVLSAATLGAAGRTVAAWLALPSWRGLPRAFWAGTAALALALTGIGANALSSGPPSSSETATEGPGVSAREPSVDDDPRTPPSPGISAGVGTRSPRTLPGRSTTRALTPDEVAALTRLARPAGPDSAPDDTGPSPARESLSPADEPDPEVEPPDARGGPVRSEPGATDRAVADRSTIEGIVRRQLQAVQSENRGQFLQDFHVEARDEAAREFDDAYAGATDFRSTISNLEIEFLEPDHAIVTFDVDYSFVVRADGRTLRDSNAEAWELVRENGRWWIVEWS